MVSSMIYYLPSIAFVKIFFLELLNATIKYYLFSYFYLILVATISNNAQK